LNRAFTLLVDSRDGLKTQRTARILADCYNCRTELNCTEVCPKEISPTRAIKHIQKQACLNVFQKKPNDMQFPVEILEETAPNDQTEQIDTVRTPSRRRFLKQAAFGLSAAATAAVGGVLVSAAIGPAMRQIPSQWVPVGRIDDFKTGSVTTKYIRYRARDGFYQSQRKTAILIAGGRDPSQLAIYSSRCTHLGCTIRWDERKHLFLCACHGGAFNIDGTVNAGPPPRPLDRHAFKVENGTMFVEVV
jgi:succinate dehydrogenase / fumarate reductase iron-sulfur subunit